ncbi:hypothetical protein E2C01_077010 [Portunus trituberculatus]|uniref:Uncharacterized protein n=1 Tax=Portunus trituberculatus TaxID=210409 RepID=A0A5B7IAA4_PORTR|nr:hypothetical protein [Portunus trituberculatus]
MQVKDKILKRNLGRGMRLSPKGRLGASTPPLPATCCPSSLCLLEEDWPTTMPLRTAAHTAQLLVTKRCPHRTTAGPPTPASTGQGRAPKGTYFSFQRRNRKLLTLSNDQDSVQDLGRHRDKLTRVRD